MAFENNTVVWASAGTGKTRKLVEVYVDLLESGADPLRVVAVTFTEKAAAEMRDRIRTAIYARLAAAAEQDRGRWMRVLGVLPAAPISTIHGFCGILLRERGLALDIDPDFAVLNEQRSLDLARESIVETLRTEIRAGNEGVAHAFGDFGLDRLVETVVQAGYWLNSLGKEPHWLEGRVQAQQEAADALMPLLADMFAQYGHDCETIGTLADELDAKKAKHPFKKRDDPSAALPRIGQVAGVETSRRLSELVVRASIRFQAKKRALHALDFDDLLLGARDLLARFDSIRAYYQDRFQALLVDEFQDTDEVQAAIIELLAQDPTGERRFAQRKLMVVGDPKQSIYRFRRARVTVFFRMKEAILQDGGVLEYLQENWRSAPPIAEFANRLSETMMDGLGKETVGEDVDLTYRVRFSQADRLVPKSAAPFLGITYVAADDEARAAEGRGMEAEAMARLLKKWKLSGTIQSWKEVAMLFRATSNMNLYIDALEAHDIPVYVIQGTYFYRKAEVSDLIAMMELIVHPGDPLLRAQVCSSSLGGLTFKDLLEGQGSPELDAILQPWIEMRDRATAAEILEDVVRQTNFDVVMMAQRNGPQRVANIGNLIEITRDFARQGTTALDDVVRHLRDRAHDMTIREAEAQVVGQDDDVVRILTVHQSKGLEFDIVLVPDLAARTAHHTDSRTFLSDRWGILAGAAYGLHRKALPNSLILTAKKEDEDQNYEEEKRLLYVAVTRAKKMLVLGEGFAKHGGPWMKWVRDTVEQVQPGAIEKAREGKTVKVRAKDFTMDIVPASILNVPEQLSLSVGSAMVGGESVVAQFRELKASLGAGEERLSSVDLTPSDLSALSGCFQYFHLTRVLGIAEPGMEGRGDSSAMRLGTRAHKILELGLREAARELPDLEQVFDSPQWRALDTADPERELAFMIHLDVDGRDCWVRGRMDAVVAGDIPRVIDYKYARWREGDEDSYDLQLTAYCVALMKSLGTARAVGELWYLKSPMKIVQREYTLVEAEERLRVLMGRYMQVVESGEWPKAARSYCDREECGFRSRCFLT